MVLTVRVIQVLRTFVIICLKRLYILHVLYVEYFNSFLINLTLFEINFSLTLWFVLNLFHIFSLLSSCCLVCFVCNKIWFILCCAYFSLVLFFKLTSYIHIICIYFFFNGWKLCALKFRKLKIQAKILNDFHFLKLCRETVFHFFVLISSQFLLVRWHLISFKCHKPKFQFQNPQKHLWILWVF